MLFRSALPARPGDRASSGRDCPHYRLTPLTPRPPGLRTPSPTATASATGPSNSSAEPRSATTRDYPRSPFAPVLIRDPRGQFATQANVDPNAGERPDTLDRQIGRLQGCSCTSLNERQQAPKPQVAGSIPVPPAQIIRGVGCFTRCPLFMFARDSAHYCSKITTIFLGLQQTLALSYRGPDLGRRSPAFAFDCQP